MGIGSNALEVEKMGNAGRLINGQEGMEKGKSVVPKLLFTLSRLVPVWFFDFNLSPNLHIALRL